MKRIILIVGGVVVVLLLAAIALIGSAFVGRQSIADGDEVNGVRIVKDGIVSVGVVPVGAGKVALIDAGNDTSGKAILAELSRRQFGNDAVVAILLTHGHPDHLGAIKLFTSAQVMALAPETGLVEGSEGSHGPLTRLFPARPTGIKVSRALRDGEVVTVGDTELRVYAVPGHTGGSAAYLVKGVLFVGDAADAGSDGKIVGAPWIFSDNQAQDRASVAQLGRRLQQEGADVRAIDFAHSGMNMEGLAALTAFAQANP